MAILDVRDVHAHLVAICAFPVYLDWMPQVFLNPAAELSDFGVRGFHRFVHEQPT